jgi:Spy/CpxP family protein refolding chaperone
MKKAFVLICVCILALPIVAMSQGQRQGQQQNIETTPWWNRPVVKNLGLSDDQLAQIKTIVRDSRDHLIQLRADVKMAEGALSDTMSQDPIDTAKASVAIDKVVAARGELMRSISQMSLKLRQILTASQWQELRQRGVQRIMKGITKRSRAGRTTQQQ